MGLLLLFLFAISSVFGEGYLAKTCTIRKMFMSSCIIECTGEHQCRHICEDFETICSYSWYKYEEGLIASVNAQTFDTIDVFELGDDMVLRKRERESNRFIKNLNYCCLSIVMAAVLRDRC